MMKLCSASLLLLFTIFHSGSALHCYESSCLGDLNLNNCPINNRTILKECNLAILAANLNKLRDAGGSVNIPSMPPTSWICVKHELTGMQNSQPAKIDLKMCYPGGPNVCTDVVSAAKGLETRLGLQVISRCNTCPEDSCNPAHKPTASSFVALVAVAASMLLLRH